MARYDVGRAGGSTATGALSYRGRSYAQKDEEKEEKPEAKGLFGLGFGPDINLGGTTLVKELGGALHGIAQLGTAWMPGGAPAGEVYSRAGKGILSTLAGSAPAILGGIGGAVGSIVPGAGTAAGAAAGAALGGLIGSPLVSLYDDKVEDILGEGYKPKSLVSKISERGLLPGLVEDVGNVALGAGAVSSIASRAGAAGRIGAAGQAARVAERAGMTADDIARATTAAQEAARAGQRVGPALKQAGVSANRFTPLGRVGRTAARATDLTADAGQVATAANRLAALEGLSHPYRTVFQGLVRPVTRAAQAAEVARSAATATREVVSASDEAALANAYGTMPTPKRTTAGPGPKTDEGALRQAYGETGPMGQKLRAAQESAARPASASPIDPDAVVGGTPPRIGPTEEMARRLVGEEIPEWATEFVAGRGAGMERRLSSMEGRIQRHVTNRVARERARFAQADRQMVLSSRAITSAKAAAQYLIDKTDDAGVAITPERANAMVFDHISRQLDQTALLEEAISRGAPVGLIELIREKTGAKFTIPKRYLEDGALADLLTESQAEWKTLAAEREQVLLGSRLGAKGLEDIHATTPLLTNAQVKEFRRLQKEYRRIARQNAPRAEKEAVAKAAQLVRTEDGITKLLNEAEGLRGEAAAQRDIVRDISRPVGLENANRPATWQRVTEAVSARGGALLDHHSGQLIQASKYMPPGQEAAGASGWVVGVVGKTYAASEWAANPTAVLDDFMGEYMPALQHQDSRVRVQVQGDKVTIDVAQTTLDGKALTRGQATVLAQARGETRVANLDGNDIPVATDPTSMVVAAHHVAEIYKPRSQFNQWLRSIDRLQDRLLTWDAEMAEAEMLGRQVPEGAAAQMGPFLDEADFDGFTQLHMRIALGDMNARGVTLEQHYGQLAVEARATANSTPADALMQLYLSPSFNPGQQLNKDLWKKAVKYLGADAERALRWYNEGHDTVVRRWGDKRIQLWDTRTQAVKEVAVSDLVFSILAITSVNASPISNMGTTMAGISRLVDYKQMGDWMGRLNEAFTEYTDVRRKMHPTGVPSDPGASDALKATDLYETLARYVPHMDNVRDDVMEILGGRLLDEWDNEYLRQRLERDALTPEATAKRYNLGGTADLASARGKLETARKKHASMKTDKGRATWSENVAELENEVRRLERSSAKAIEGLSERDVMDLAGSTAYAKMRNFWENLRDPEGSKGVTLDRVMADLLGLQGGNWSRKGVYQEASVAIRKLAKQVGVPPHAVQALLWVYTKRLTNEQDLGRLFAAGIDAIDSLTPENAAMWREGRSPLHDWLQSDITHFETTEGITPRQVPSLEMPGGLTGRARFSPEDLAAMRKKGKRVTQEQYSFFQKADIDRIRERLGKARKAPTNAQKLAGLPGTPKEFGALADDIADMLESGRIMEAQDRLMAWVRDRAGDYSMEAEYFEQFFEEGQAGIGVTYQETLAALRRQGLIAEDGGPAGSSVLFQRFGEDAALGAMFNNTQTGRLTMQFFKGADPTTLVHESGHLLRHILPLEDIATLERIYGGAVGDVVFEERFADDLLRHMNTNRAPQGLENVFGRVRETLRSWWEAVAGRFANRIDPGVAEIFDRYLAPDVTHPVPDLPEMKLDLSGKTPAQIAANLPRRPGETAGQALERGRKAGQAVAKAEWAERQAAKVSARAERMKSVRDQMAELLETGGNPEAVAMRRAMIANEKAMERLTGAVDTPPVSRVPGPWKPLWGALEGLWEEAANNEALALAMEGIPKTFPELIAYATEKGLNPTHVASLTDDKVRRLVFEPLNLKAKEVSAGTRSTRTQAFAMDRSIEALAAAQVDVVLEANTNQLVDFIETAVARPLAEGQVVPQGWREWNPVDMYTRTEAADGGLRRAAGPARPRYMVPNEVGKMLSQYGRNYDHTVLSGLRRVTNPWRTLVLTWAPRWYVNNFIGNAILATKGGVKLEDWASAWREYRKGGGKGRLGRGARAFEGEAAQVTGTSLYSDVATGQQSLVGREYDNVWQAQKGARADVAAAGGGRLRRAKAAHDVAAAQVAKANTVVDEIARVAVYNSAKRRGFSAEKSLQMTFDAMVDYGDLGPLEKALVRSVVPFYAWQKGVLKQVARFPLDHPIASNVALQLGILNEDLHEGLPEMYSGLLDLPGVGSMNLRAANPFQDAEALITPEGIARSTNPFLQVFLRNAMRAPATGYPEYQSIDAFGRVMPDTNPAEEFVEIATGLPQVQVGAGLLGQEKVGDRPVGDSAALRFLGVPTVSRERVDQLRERLAKSKARMAGISLSERGQGAREGALSYRGGGG